MKLSTSSSCSLVKMSSKCRATRHALDISSSSIVVRGNDTFKRRIREAIEIHCQAPTLNRDVEYELPAIYRNALSRNSLSTYHVTKTITSTTTAAAAATSTTTTTATAAAATATAIYLFKKLYKFASSFKHVLIPSNIIVWLYTRNKNRLVFIANAFALRQYGEPKTSMFKSRDNAAARRCTRLPPM